MVTLQKKKKHFSLIHYYPSNISKRNVRIIYGSMAFITNLDDRESNNRLLRMVRHIDAEAATAAGAIQRQGLDNVAGVRNVMLTKGYQQVDLWYEAKVRSLLKAGDKWVRLWVYRTYTNHSAHVQKSKFRVIFSRHFALCVLAKVLKSKNLKTFWTKTKRFNRYP